MSNHPRTEFDDGDRKQLKRTQIRPKGQRHFVNTATIMNMPLTDPEKFAFAAGQSTESAAPTTRCVCV